MKTIAPDRRKFARNALGSRFEIDLLQPHTQVSAASVNFSEGGLCFRLRQMLEVRSLVRLRLTPEGSSSRSGAVHLDCKGRVAWVIQRLDLSDAPPFYYDVGIEFVDPPAALRQLMASTGGQLSRLTRGGGLPAAVIRDRRYVPRLERDTGHAMPWHLIVQVDGSPCFSGRYATKREAAAAWTRFKRQQPKSHVAEGGR